MSEPSDVKQINIHIRNSMPRTKCNVIFEPLPFFKKIYSVLEPMVIYCEPKAKLENEQSEEPTELLIQFKVPLLILRMFSCKSRHFRLQIRFGERLEGKRDVLDKLPGLTKICVNSMISSSSKTSPINYQCDNLVEENIISVLWLVSNQPYYMMIEIVEIASVKDLMERIRFNNNLYGFNLNTKAKAIELMKSSVIEILESKIHNFTLLCPISKLKMKFPTRSLKCIHLDCFDLFTFILLNKVNQKWICPICKIPIKINELVIDPFLLDIVNNSTLPENCFEITLHANGEWVPRIEEAMDGIEYNQSELDDEYSENSIVLTDLDDPNFEKLLDQNNFDEDVKPEEKPEEKPDVKSDVKPEKKPILPITNSLNPSKPMLIDLTIDVTDIKEEPLTKIIKIENADK